MADNVGFAPYKKEAEQFFADVQKAIKEAEKKKKNGEIATDVVTLGFSANGLNAVIEISDGDVKYFTNKDGEYAPITEEKFEKEAAYLPGFVLTDALKQIRDGILKVVAQSESLEKDSVVVDDKIKIVSDAKELDKDMEDREQEISREINEEPEKISEKLEKSLDEIRDEATRAYKNDAREAKEAGAPSIAEEQEQDEDEILPGQPNRPY